MLRVLFALLPVTLALQPQDFRVPPVDFTQLSSAANNANNLQLLSILQENGIVALQNVPNYALLRREYLRTAADCAVKAQEHDAEFLLHRQLRDGTNRYTVSLESGRQLDEALVKNPQLLALCPEYVQVYSAFSAAVELAVANVGTALDATQQFKVVVEQGEVAMTARKLLEESVHLDHFHAYEAAAAAETDDTDVNVADLSLELHTDNGLMIAMSAPEYFDVLPSGQVQHKQTKEQNAGLLIQTAKGEIVRPVLKPDELVLMLGSGIDDWIHTTPPLHSVLHGMRYPRGISVVGNEEGGKVLRAWFGKMVLLEAHHVMANTGMTFGQYANQTTRYLVEQGAEDHAAFGAVACPPQRHLAASDNSCSLKKCQLKSTASASDLTDSCQITCNHDSTGDATLCEKYCDCEASTSSGTNCWMLCVENFSSDVCPGEQKCNNAGTKQTLAMTCVAGTVAPSASTPTTTSPTSTPSTTSATSTPTTTSATPTPPTTSAPPTPPTTSAPDSGASTNNNAGNSSTTPPSTTTSSPSTTTATPTSPTTTPSTAGSVSTSSAANAGSVAASPDVGDDSTTASNAEETSSATSSASASSSTSSSTSAASVLHVALFVNGVAVLVAAFLCIQ